MATKQKKKWSKVNSQKRLTVVEYWLMQGKEANEKETNHPAHPMDRTVNWCSHGGNGSLWPINCTKFCQKWSESGLQ
jgi:hypothetical protein